MKNWSLEKIYEQRVRGSGRVPKPSLIVREFKSKVDVKRAITDANPEFKAGADKRGSIRMSPVGKAGTRDEMEQDFKDTLEKISLVIVDTIRAGDRGAPSSKFDSYKVKSAGGEEFVITLAGGAASNKGMAFERDILESIKEYFADPENVEEPSIITQLENALDGVKFTGCDEEATFTRRVSRPLTDKPNDKGEVIADITLLDENDNKYYISLKDVGGKTVGNAGASGMFSELPTNNIKFVNKEKNDIGKKLMHAAGVDISFVERGLSDYNKEKKSPPVIREPVDTTAEADTDKLLDFMASAFDYGYIYVKRKNLKNHFEIEDLTDKEKLYDFIGEIQKVVVKYPYYDSTNKMSRRKNLSINITTENGRYSFDIRNASGGIIPTQINLVRAGSTADAKTAVSNVKRVKDSNKELEDLLSQ